MDVVGFERRYVGSVSPRRVRSSRRRRRRVCRGDWGTIRCSLRRRSGRAVRRGLGLVGGRRGCGLGWSLGRMWREGERREGMLRVELVVFMPGHSQKNLLAIRRRGGGHAAECPGLEPPGLMTMSH